MASIVIFNFASQKIGIVSAYSLMTDANKLLAFAVSFSGFMFFKNLNIRQNRFINTVSASTFGVFLIHANSDVMREFLWKDLLSCVQMYNSNWLFLHAVFSVVGVYVICTAIDYLRIRFVEIPFMKFLDSNSKKIDIICNRVKNIFR